MVGKDAAIVQWDESLTCSAGLMMNATGRTRRLPAATQTARFPKAAAFNLGLGFGNGWRRMAEGEQQKMAAASSSNEPSRRHLSLPGTKAQAPRRRPLRFDQQITLANGEVRDAGHVAALPKAHSDRSGKQRWRCCSGPPRAEVMFANMALSRR
ncbi:hypothetical protein [Bradyrhizobium sp. 153]|uniref:hypothetical protein n=1 Tax=Bradyrhizobium sp. 153 TaxID=2782627 RepID=UPI001FFBA638|nr:hypothetical protein [Bradyrhizobium sp. 153]MCK1667865.1 hypothetical protein [Bradyrhizobium sp. 153]